jgi:hypothetical protein
VATLSDSVQIGAEDGDDHARLDALSQEDQECGGHGEVSGFPDEVPQIRLQAGRWPPGACESSCGAAVAPGSGNSRNRSFPKTVITDIVKVGVKVPRDLNSSIGPVTVPEGQRRLDGRSARMTSLSARGVPKGDTQAHVAEMCWIEISPDTISRINVIQHRLSGRTHLAARFTLVDAVLEDLPKGHVPIHRWLLR